MGLPVKTYIHSSSAPWIVLVNGLFASKCSWSECLEYFENFNILTYDAKGQGEGPTLSKPYSLDEQVDDLKKVLEENNLKRVSLLGLSNGGRVALKFSSLYPKQVISVVACDTYAEITPIIKLKLESWLKAQENGGAVHRFDVAAPWVWGETILKTNSNLVQKYRDLAKNSNEDNSEFLIKGALSGNINLNSIVAPVHFVVGEEDLLTPVIHHKKLQKMVKNSELTVVPGGHASVLENPLSIRNSIMPFFRRQYELD